MKTHKPFRYAAFVCMIVLAFASCKDDEADDDDSSSAEYAEATAKVDYEGSKQAVFFKFSTGAITEVPLDFFDIAISTSDAKIIANSGSYGAGIQVLKTEETDITKDLSSKSGDIKAYTFRDNYDVSPGFIKKHQTTANPFAGEFNNPAAGSGKVYAIKKGTSYFKVMFNSFGPMGQYKLTVVKELNGTEKKEISGSLGSETDYGYVYFDLTGQKKIDAAAAKIPKAADWDILCTRTNDIVDYQGEPYLAGRSSILINSSNGVKAATVTDKAVEDVLTIPAEDAFSGDIDAAIGFSWYKSSAGMPPTFSVNTNTYVIKTVDGGYAKFQPDTFTGPDGEKFYMKFRYLYQPSGSEFSQ